MHFNEQIDEALNLTTIRDARNKQNQTASS